MAGTFDYGKVAGIASKVLTQFSQGTIELIVETPGNGPASNPGSPTRTTYALKGTAQGVPSRYVAAGLADAGDLEIIAAVHATAPEPKPGMIVTIDGAEYRVVSSGPIPPSGVRVVWKFIVRR